VEAELLFGCSLDGFSQSQRLFVERMQKYKGLHAVRLDNLPADTPRMQVSRLLGSAGERRIIIARGKHPKSSCTAVAFFTSKRGAARVSVRLGSSFTLRGAAVTCTWSGKTRQEISSECNFDLEFLRKAQDSVEEGSETVESLTEESAKDHIEAIAEDSIGASKPESIEEEVN
jgi:hypothetical protein